MAFKSAAPNLFEIGFDLAKLTGFHPDRLHLGILPILQLGQYFGVTVINFYLLFNEALCSDTLEDFVENGMVCFAIITQVKGR